MEITRRKAYGLAVVLLVLTIVVLYLSIRTTRVEDPIRLVLPDAVGDYVGVRVRICQNDQCMRGVPLAELADPDQCPTCGGEMDDLAPGEKKMLPPDTRILKRRYQSQRGGAFFVSAVLGGRERRSIHKPEICLVAQGQAIVARRVVETPVGDGRTLDVMLLDVMPKTGRGRSSSSQGATSYAYWFASAGRETPYHFERLLWTAVDGIVHNRRKRWAYVAVSSARASGSDRHVREVTKFIAELYPLLDDG